MSEPNPDEFVAFIETLTENAPEGYEPWLFRCEQQGKNPELSYGSWKDESARLSVPEAVEWLKGGGNVGIAATEDDPLINVDVDDDEETEVEDVKDTLLVRSRSRTGFHALYFEADASEEIPNIPTDDAGEVRARWQYVVAPGSYVPVDDESELPEEERDMAGYYTVLRDQPAAEISYDELPQVFLDYDTDEEMEVDSEEMPGDAGDIEDFDGDEQGGYDEDDDHQHESALFDISARDVVLNEHGSVNIGDRWEAMFHGSETGANMSFSNQGLINCWRHSVAHNGLQALAVLSDYDGSCQEVGTGKKNSNAGGSCLKKEQGAHIWHAWKYAKQNGYIPDDDPVPYSAMLHVAQEREICPTTDLPKSKEESLPAYAYDAVLESIDGHDGINHGRKKTDEFDTSSKDGGPELDITTEADKSQTNNETQPRETDGGSAGSPTEPTTPDTGTVDPFRDFSAEVLNAIEEQSEERITAKTCRHRIAEAFTDYYDFIYPGDDVRGWISTLYVYNRDQGVYEPRGEEFIKQKLEAAAYDYVTNQVKNEVVGKVERMSIETAGRFERGGALEPEPYEIVVNNGILNLKTGELSPFSPTEHHRTKIDIRWNPEAGNPDAIDDFLHDIVDDSDVPTLYRLIAHTLYKEYIAEKAAILIGSGQNGKSVFLDLIEHFVGRWNVAHRELQDFDDDGFAANNLQGKLANLATEIGEQELRDTTVFKKLTGRDTLDAQVKYKSPVTFENYATMMFATNEMPVFGQDNHAIWRRWVYVDFPYTFGDGEDEKPATPKSVLMDRLTDDSELESLLWRCQQEIQRWHENGEDFFADAMPPEEVREQMKKAAEPVYNFATSCLEQGDPEEDFVKKETVRAAYRAYADEEDLPRVAENEFGSRLLSLRDFTMEAGQKRVDGGRPTVYKGVTLSSRGRQVLGLDDPEDGDQQQVDDNQQVKAVVKEELRAMADENDGEPVPREGVIWRCSGEITKVQADNAIDDLLRDGDAMTTDGGETLLPTDV